MSVSRAEQTSQAQHVSDTYSEELNIRHRAIGIAFYACMIVVSFQVVMTIMEVVWGGAQGGIVPEQVSKFAVMACIPWVCNLIALALRVSRATVAWVRTETVFGMSLIATFIGTYNLGFNVQIGAFGIYCGVIGTLRAGQLNGNIRVCCLFLAALAALATRPGGLSDAQLMSASAVNDSIAWNLFAPFLQPYSLGIVINFAVDFLMKSYQGSREQLEKAYEELNDRLERDTLTELLSRAVLESKFSAVKEAADNEDCRIAVALIDLDNFKNINTFCGHGAGDKALIAFAERLQARLPDAELFRLGGDEFLAIQLVKDDGHLLIDQLKASARPLKIGYQNDELLLSASVGLTMVAADCDYQKAASEADIALRQAKRQGKGALVRFEAGHSVPSASNAARPALAVSPFTAGASKKEIPAREVGSAILANQIDYAIQPIFDIKAKRISGAECLLRWRLEDGSFVPIDHYLNTFIALEWQAPYMDHLLEKRQQLYSALRLEQSLTIHFNFTAEALQSDAFRSRVIEPLQTKPANLEGFVIEISEKGSERMGTVIGDADLAVLRNTGVRIAIDDFGVGHSNLERLANIDADIVKLDKQFVVEGTRTRRGLEILRHARQLTESLDINLIAEGIETPEQEAMLAEVGITEHQGFYRGRPTSPTQFIRNLRQTPCSRQLAV